MSAPVGLEYKNVTALDPAASEGVIEALVAVTGVRDDVGDIIVPGAFTKTLVDRKPKVCLGHDWNRPIGKTLDIKELMPGDPNLPKTTGDGKPWPKAAGAVWARFQTNMDIDDGKNAFHSAKFYGPESSYSIGYKATTAKHRGDTRYIHELDLFEFGPVLHPANRLATLQSIKSGEPDEIEFTDLELDEEKGVTVEELTLRDYAAILDIMEEKAVSIRRVEDSEYWGLPVGTIIKPGMKPKGKGKGGSASRGTTTAKPASAPKTKPHPDAPVEDDEKPATKPKAKPDKPAETEQSIRAVAEELGYEMRPNPAPPEYIVKPPKGTRGYGGRVMSFESDTGRARASNGQVVPTGRVEEFMRVWHQQWEKGKDGYEPRADEVLDEMERPAREAAAKQENERKKREILAGATDEQLAGQAEFEINRLKLLDERVATRGGDASKVRATGVRNLELINEERAKRGLSPIKEPATPTTPPAAHPSLEEFGPEVPGLSTKPTGGRSIEEILDSMPVTTETQNVRYRIAHGEDVLDDPTGSGLIAVMESRGKKKEWTVTVGSGQSLPTGALLGDATNDKTAMPTTPKKMKAWLTALGSLRDADGNPPQYGAPDAKTTLGFTDAEGRSLAQAIRETAVPAYLAAIGKDDGFQDRSTPAMWKRDTATAMMRLPLEMRAEVRAMGLNARQGYFLNRSEGADHATALKRARDMIANAQQESTSAREQGRQLVSSPRNRLAAVAGAAQAAAEDIQAARDTLPTGPSYAPVNRTSTDNQLQPTPDGEISTDRLLTLDRTTGPAAIAAMELPELERHDAELTRRAAELGKPGQVSPAHDAIKKALSRKREERRLADAAAADEAMTPDQRRAREITDAPANVADARRMGRMSRGEIALREVNKELPLDDISVSAYNVMRLPGGPDAARSDGIAAAELARGIASDAEFLSRADHADQVADLIDSWGVDLGEESDLPAKLRAWGEGIRAGISAPEQREAPAPLRSAGPTAAAQAEMAHYRAMSDEDLAAALAAARLRAQTDTSARNEIFAINRELDSRESARRDVPRAPDAAPAAPEQTATITPELLDVAAESEAASVGLSETPDGALEVDAEVADRQDRVEKLIKQAEDGKLDLAAQSTETLIATRRDLTDELRLQTAIARRTPRAQSPADAPKVRPGLAGAAEDHAEALRSGDAAAIERTRIRLESSIRRSRVDSETARSLADSVVSPDDNDAGQLSELAKRLRAESRERRNAAARKRRTVKRIERERIRSLLGAVDNELRGRGVDLPQETGPRLEVSLSPDEEIENKIHEAYLKLAEVEEDWIRLARIARLTGIDPADWERMLKTMAMTGLVHLVPESNRKVITDEDRTASIRIGSEDKHLIAFDRDYVPVTNAVRRAERNS